MESVKHRRRVVVLASLLGTGDLGQSVLTGLQKQHVGDAAAAGLGIVLLAIALDRITTGERTHSFNRWAAALPPRACPLPGASVHCSLSRCRCFQLSKHSLNLDELCVSLPQRALDLQEAFDEEPE